MSKMTIIIRIDEDNNNQSVGIRNVNVLFLKGFNQGGLSQKLVCYYY